MLNAPAERTFLEGSPRCLRGKSKRFVDLIGGVSLIPVDRVVRSKTVRASSDSDVFERRSPEESPTLPFGLPCRSTVSDIDSGE